MFCQLQDLSVCSLPICALSCLPRSDNEEDHVSRNGRQEALEFKDEEETVTTKSIQITQATETTTTTTRKRSGAASSKTLDLGAAAHYTGDKSSEDKVLTVLLVCLWILHCVLTWCCSTSSAVNSTAVLKWRYCRPARDRPCSQPKHNNRWLRTATVLKTQGYNCILLLSILAKF